MWPINYKLFGGEEAFATVVREAEEHTGKKLRRGKNESGAAKL
jgi:hypothetical protein